MNSIGTFFFRNRKGLFLFLYPPLLLPSPRLFVPEYFGEWYFLLPIILGLAIIILGEIIRRLTRVQHGALLRKRKLHADQLVVEGIFSHCRNPLYVANLTVILGLGILANSVFYVVMVVPYAFFIYFAIVWAEESFLREKFGKKFELYCDRVPRWKFHQAGLHKTLREGPLSYRDWLAKEYKTLLVWLLGLALLVLIKYPELWAGVNRVWVGVALVVILIYGYVRHLNRPARPSKTLA